MIERGMHALQVSALSVVMVDAEIMKGYVARDSFEMKRVNASKHYQAKSPGPVSLIVLDLLRDLYLHCFRSVPTFNLPLRFVHDRASQIDPVALLTGRFPFC
jgi:hypothetical protein